MAEEFVKVVEQEEVDEGFEEFRAGQDSPTPLVVPRVKEVLADLGFGFEFAVNEEECEGAGEVEDGVAEGSFLEVEDAGDLGLVAGPGCEEDVASNEIQVEGLGRQLVGCEEELSALRQYGKM